MVCINKTWHWRIYYADASGKPTVKVDIPTGQGPCSCDDGSAQSGRARSTDLHCPHLSYNGIAVTYTYQIGPVAGNDLEDNSPSSNPIGGSGGSFREDKAPPQVRGAPALAATAFAKTVPFRQYGIPSLYSGLSTNIAPRCNERLNPTAFWINPTSAVASRINLCTGRLVADIPIPPRSLQIAVTPNGKWAIITSFDNAITFIDTETNKVAKTIRTPVTTNPSGIAITPEGDYALVTDIGTGPSLMILDIAAQEITDSIPLDRSFPQSVYLSPDTTLAWVTFPIDNVVQVIDLLTGMVSRVLAVPTPTSIAFNPTGTVAYVSNGSANGGVLVVDTRTYAVTTTIPTGSGATDLQLSDEGRLLTVNNYYAGSITVIDTATQTAQTESVGSAPRNVAPVPVQ
jgi:DNA-binding beta-propeller fold protein YncE